MVTAVHRWPRPVQDVKKTCQEHDAPKRQVGCSQQRDRVFQSRTHQLYISSRQSCAHFRPSCCKHSLNSAIATVAASSTASALWRAISRRQKVHASFIWTAKTLRLHTVLSRARWTPGTDGSPHSMTVPERMNDRSGLHA